MDTPSLDSVLLPGDKHHISLSRLTGKPIKDITGYISKEFGDPVFKISTILLEGHDKPIWVEGEHDLPYIADTLPGVTDEVLEALYAEAESR